MSRLVEVQCQGPGCSETFLTDRYKPRKYHDEGCKKAGMMASRAPTAKGNGTRAAKEFARTRVCEHCGSALGVTGNLVYCTARCGFSRIIKDTMSPASSSTAPAARLDEDVEEEEDGEELSDGVTDEEDEDEEVPDGEEDDGGKPPEKPALHRRPRSTNPKEKVSFAEDKKTPGKPSAAQLAHWLAEHPDRKRREILSAADALAATRQMMEKL